MGRRGPVHLPRPGGDSLAFVTSENLTIRPDDIYTDGGSVPRVFWSVRGLSPWGMGPAYVIHDWIYHLHRCGTPEQRARIGFRQSARILEEVAIELQKAGMLKESASYIGAIRWAVSGPIAFSVWNRPATAQDCAPPPKAAEAATLRRKSRSGAPAAAPAAGRTIMDLTIPRY